MSRQIFFVSQGGYDTHNNFANHSSRLGEVSNALAEFYAVLEELGMENDVVTFSISDFGRTLTSNGNGSDHAWGGHAVVMGGPIKGGNLYGHFPPMLAGNTNPSSLDVSDRGRIIPTTSVDQYSAPMASWFGADSNSIETIFPNLGRFDDPLSSATANLKFI